MTSELVDRPPGANSTPTPKPRPRPNPLIFIAAVALVVVPFLFWYLTWFGRHLSNQEMAEYLASTSAPHKTQHALAQMAERITQGDPSVKQWYPQLLALSRSPLPQFRLTAAWVMGQDNSSAAFHQALLELLHDPEPAVQWNAALALVRFGDSAGEPELRLMLQPYILRAPQAGTVKFLVKKGDKVGAGSIVGRVKAGEAKPEDVVSPLAGEIQEFTVTDGATVAQDGSLAVLMPGEEQVWECLRGLYFVGKAPDVEEIETYLHNMPRLPERVKQQAEITIQAIKSRSRASKVEK